MFLAATGRTSATVAWWPGFVGGALIATRWNQPTAIAEVDSEGYSTIV